ncbi:MAG: hypothetical protein AAFV53_22290 [Myxococcota bacterium]
MPRTNRIEIALNDNEMSRMLQHAAKTHATAKGVNLARFIREAALEQATASGLVIVAVDWQNNAESFWDTVRQDSVAPAPLKALADGPDQVMVSVVVANKIRAYHPDASSALVFRDVEDLDDLAEGLNSLTGLMKGNVIPSNDPDVGMDDGDLRRAYGVDWTDIPQFGGDEPDDTVGVWSWDDERFLVGEAWEVEIVDREIGVDAARVLDNERLEGLMGAHPKHVPALRRLLEAADDGDEDAVRALRDIQDNRQDGEEGCGWKAILKDWEEGLIEGE